VTKNNNYSETVADKTRPREVVWKCIIITIQHGAIVNNLVCTCSVSRYSVHQQYWISGLDVINQHHVLRY